MYVRVYSPNGEQFEVTRHRADYLLLEAGWTQTPPVFLTEAEVPTADQEPITEPPAAKKDEPKRARTTVLKKPKAPEAGS